MPLVYRKIGARVDLLRCAHGPDFAAPEGEVRYRAFRTLNLLVEIDEQLKHQTELDWWDEAMLREGSLWDDPATCAELTTQLCAFLNSEARRALDVVQFIQEVPDSVERGRTLDMTAQPSGTTLLCEGRSYTLFDVVLPMECKRLPTPDEQGRDEREYVIVRNGGTTGAIQRYKIGAHGKAHAVAVIIGYIQEGDADSWLQCINGWLADAAGADPSWAGEQLTATVEGANAGAVSRLHSRHRRVSPDGALIDMWHLWIALGSGAGRRRGGRLRRDGPRSGQIELPFVYLGS